MNKHTKITASLLGLLVVGAIALGIAQRDPEDARDRNREIATPAPPVKTRTGARGTSTVVKASAVTWEKLNPARGDKSPAAATLWGDRNGAEATGFLVRFVDGFSSPPHIHNVSYRGVVIQGLVHNDDPTAAQMWMPTGSYWTQPAGGAHITSASGGETIAYIEIDSGPYLVRPVAQASEGEERPLNAHAANLVWLDADRVGWGGGRRATNPKTSVTFLWGDPNGAKRHGLLLRLPTNATIVMNPHDAMFRAVMINGEARHRAAGGAAGETLSPGSYFSASARTATLTCGAKAPCQLYVRAEGRFEATSP